MQALNQFIDDAGLIDVPLRGRSYTWSNKRPNPTFSRIDRTMISHHWKTFGASYSMTDLPSTTSDHVHRTKRWFRFENFWLRYREVYQVVNRAWSAPTHSGQMPAWNFRHKTTAMQRQLIAWAQVKFKNRDTDLERSKWVLQQLDRVEEKQDLNSIEFRLRIRLREHIYRLAEDQEEKWKQRSGSNWLKLRDKNTKYFHAVENGRKNSNAILGIQNDQGVVVPDSELLNHIHRHFKKMIGGRGPRARPFNLTGRVGPEISGALKSLDDGIMEQEILAAINDMPKDKASGPDGLPIEFYRAFWPTIRVDTISVINFIFETGGECKMSQQGHHHTDPQEVISSGNY